MYIWSAIDVDSQLEKQKKTVQSIENKIKFEQSNVSLLPLHISLKISAEVSASDEVNIRKDIESLLKSINVFKIQVDKIEKNGNIIWIKMKENDNLNYLHNELCTIFTKYHIELHEFDKCFTYHSTLFLDDNIEKINEAFQLIKDIEIPNELVANTFVIGSSLSGQIGSYKVDTRIKANDEPTNQEIENDKVMKPFNKALDEIKRNK